MKYKILDGKKVSEQIVAEIKNQIESIKNTKQLKSPKIKIILVGNNSASESYVKNKVKYCKKAGIETDIIRFEETITSSQLLYQIEILNNSDIDGFIVQLPLPNHIDKNLIIEKILPEKDILALQP